MSSSMGSFTDLVFDGCDFSQCNRPFFLNNVVLNHSHLFSFNRCKEATNTRLNINRGSISEPVSFKNNNSYCSYYSLASIISDITKYRVSFSYEVTTISTVNDASYFSFKLADFYLDTSTPKTFTVEFAQNNSATALTDYDLSLDVYYIDDTTSKAHRETTTKILPSSNNLSSSGVTWTGLTNPTKQKVSLTTSQTGSYGLCSVYVNIFVPNLTLYICPKVDIT
jgi:hypothetical protein